SEMVIVFITGLPNAGIANTASASTDNSDLQRFIRMTVILLLKLKRDVQKQVARERKVDRPAERRGVPPWDTDLLRAQPVKSLSGGPAVAAAGPFASPELDFADHNRAFDN